MTLFDLFDKSFMGAYKLNDEQYDFICENATDEELDLLLGPKINMTDDPSDERYTFAQKRMVIAIVRKYKQLHANNTAQFDF